METIETMRAIADRIGIDVQRAVDMTDSGAYSTEQLGAIRKASFDCLTCVLRVVDPGCEHSAEYTELYRRAFVW